MYESSQKLSQVCNLVHIEPVESLLFIVSRSRPIRFLMLAWLVTTTGDRLLFSCPSHLSLRECEYQSQNLPDSSMNHDRRNHQLMLLCCAKKNETTYKIVVIVFLLSYILHNQHMASTSWFPLLYKEERTNFGTRMKLINIYSLL